MAKSLASLFFAGMIMASAAADAIAQPLPPLLSSGSSLSPGRAAGIFRARRLGGGLVLAGLGTAAAGGVALAMAGTGKAPAGQGAVINSTTGTTP